MRIDLTGKNALVTGGASGIGRACALVLAKAGARVAVVDINLEGARQTVETIGQGLAVQCDLANPEDVSAMRREVVSEMGGVDILVNCAGIISYRRGIGAVPLDEWDRVLNVNLRGTYLICREFIREVSRESPSILVSPKSWKGWARDSTYRSLLEPDT